MKNRLFFTSFVLLVSYMCCAQDGTSLRKELAILEPLVSKSWVSESTDPSGQMTLHFSRLYQPIHGGKIISIHQECPELNNFMDGFYYYDPDKKEVAFLMLTSNGNITTGNVIDEDGKILMHGIVIFADRKLEFKNYYDITKKGEVTDKYFRFEDGEWKAGHSRVWSIKRE